MFQMPIDIRPGDCDRYGHVKHAVYLAYMAGALAATVAAGGAIYAESQLDSVRRRVGTWCHDLFDVVTDRSTGVFLSWSGKLIAAPPRVLNDLQFGALVAPPFPDET